MSRRMKRVVRPTDPKEKLASYINSIAKYMAITVEVVKADPDQFVAEDIDLVKKFLVPEMKKMLDGMTDALTAPPKPKPGGFSFGTPASTPEASKASTEPAAAAASEDEDEIDFDEDDADAPELPPLNEDEDTAAVLDALEAHETAYDDTPDSAVVVVGSKADMKRVPKDYEPEGRLAGSKEVVFAPREKGVTPKKPAATEVPDATGYIADAGFLEH